MLHVLFMDDTIPSGMAGPREIMDIEGQQIRNGRGWHDHPHPTAATGTVHCLTINTNIVEQELFGVTGAEYAEASKMLEDLEYDNMRTFSPATMVAQVLKVERAKQGNAQQQLDDIKERFGPAWDNLAEKVGRVFESFLERK